MRCTLICSGTTCTTHANNVYHLSYSSGIYVYPCAQSALSQCAASRIDPFHIITSPYVASAVSISSVTTLRIVRILHSAEGDNFSPFDSKMACLCPSIDINNKKHVYRQSQVRMPNGNWIRVGWMLADHRDGLSSFKFLAWSSIAQSVCQRAFGLLQTRFQRPSGFESCIQQRKTTRLLSIRKSLACARASKLTTTNICIYISKSNKCIIKSISNICSSSKEYRP